MNFTVQSLLHSGVALTDAALERLLPSPDTLPHSIHRAMRHSTFAGGKRLRPILCMEAARMVSGEDEIPEGAAAGNEELHVVHRDVLSEPLGETVRLHRPLALDCSRGHASSQRHRAHPITAVPTVRRPARRLIDSIP